MKVVLGLGANLGDLRSALNVALAYLIADPLVGRVVRSSFYQTDPVGGPEQPEYLNAVVIVETDTDLTPLDVAEHFLSLGQTIESKLDRVREVRWGPRTIDIDVLAVDGLMTDEPRLTVPHPRVAERAFVLIPWMEIAPDFDIPGLGRVTAIAANLTAADREGVRQLVSES